MLSAFFFECIDPQCWGNRSHAERGPSQGRPAVDRCHQAARPRPERLRLVPRHSAVPAVVIIIVIIRLVGPRRPAAAAAAVSVSLHVQTTADMHRRPVRSAGRRLLGGAPARPVRRPVPDREVEVLLRVQGLPNAER